jgi:hypothetical protein
VPINTGPISTFGNEEPVAVLDFPIDYFGNPFDPQANDAGTPHAFESTVHASGNAALPGNYFNPWPPSFLPSTQIAAGENQGWTGGEAVLDMTTHQALAPGGRPIMDDMGLPPADNTTYSRTAQPPLRLPPTRRRQAQQPGKVPCPVEDCGEFIKRESDVRRHIAQKHKELKLHCPVDKCPMRFAREDKRSDHLKRGHKLGEKTISMLLEASLGEE